MLYTFILVVVYLPNRQSPHILFCVALHICVMSSNRLQCLHILQKGNKLYSSEYVAFGHGRQTASLFLVHFLSTNVPGGHTVHGRHLLDLVIYVPFLQRRLRHLAFKNGLHVLIISLPDGHCLHGLHLRPRFLTKNLLDRLYTRYPSSQRISVLYRIQGGISCNVYIFLVYCFLWIRTDCVLCIAMVRHQPKIS